MTKADYSYKINDDVISIIDLNKGNMSVTNDIENVIADIYSKEKLNPVFHKIIYRDSYGTWDGFNLSTNSFYFIGAKTEKEAKAKLNV